MNTIDYIVQLGLGIMVIIGGYLIHKVKQKENRLDNMEKRLTEVEKIHAVQSVKLDNIYYRLKDIQETLKALLHKHMK